MTKPDILYRFSLDNSSKKYTCPACSKKRFVRYMDSEKGKLMPEQVGRCDREQSCGYHYSPKDFIQDNPMFLDTIKKSWKPVDIQKRHQTNPKNINTIPLTYLEQSLQHYDQNNFVQYLQSLFHKELTRKLIIRFHLGTSKAWKGANVFWQVDHKSQIRQAKVMLYNPHTGKRIKQDQSPQQGRNKIYFAGKKLLQQAGIQQPNLKQCFFGEHQLQQFPTHKVALVESEKTAVLMTALKPDYIWLATGGKNGCKWADIDTFQVLQGREVSLFPDLGCYEDWHKKATTLNQGGYKVVVSDLLEVNASNADQQEGFDLADYFIQRDEKFGWALREGYPLFWG